MSRDITIPPNEQGVVRLFALSPQLAAMIAHAETLTPLQEALGAPPLSPDHVQITSPRQLDDLGLAGLLEQGHGIAPATLAPERARLAGLSGEVAILRSRAFGSGGAALRTSDDCTLIATFGEEPAPPPRFEPLPTGGAKGVLPGGRPDNDAAHRASRRTLLIGVAAVALLAVILLVVTGGRG